jgi:hypothetical protein
MRLQAPLAQPTVPVQAVLHTISPAAAGAAAGADAGALSFTVVDASSADASAAWQAPQQWMQVSLANRCLICFSLSLHDSL